MTAPDREVTLQDLGELSKRAAVAFAARCARRVRPVMDGLPADFTDRAIALAQVDTAIRDAEDFARAMPKPHAELDACAVAAMAVAEAAYPLRRLGAYAAAHAVKAAAEASRAHSDAVGMEIVAEAYGANRVALSAGTGSRLDEVTGSKVRTAIRADCDALKKIGGGSFGDLGNAVDTSEAGPLGPLWPQGKPAGF